MLSVDSQSIDPGSEPTLIHAPVIHPEQLTSAEVAFPAAYKATEIVDGLGAVIAEAELAVGNSALVLPERPSSGRYFEKDWRVSSEIIAQSYGNFITELPSTFARCGIVQQNLKESLAAYLSNKSTEILDVAKTVSTSFLNFELRRCGGSIGGFAEWHVDGSQLEEDHLPVTYIETLFVDLDLSETDSAEHIETGTVYVPNRFVPRSEIVKLWEETEGCIHETVVDRVHEQIHALIEERLKSDREAKEVHVGVGHWALFPGTAYRGLLHRSAILSPGIKEIERCVFIARMNIPF